jgi:hypothetical protein
MAAFMRFLSFRRLHPFRLVLLVEMAWSAIWLLGGFDGGDFWWLGAPLLWPVFRLLADRKHEALKMALGVVLLVVWNFIATRFEHVGSCLTGAVTRAAGFYVMLAANGVAIALVEVWRLVERGRLRRPVAPA